MCAFCRQKIRRSSIRHQSHTEVVCVTTRPGAGREKDACFDRNSPKRSAQKLLRLVCLNEEHIVEMDMLIGPLLERNGAYGYDIFTVKEGLRSSFRYPRLDAARYDQRALIAETRRDPRYNVLICETQTEFEQLVEATRGGDATAAKAEQQY